MALKETQVHYCPGFLLICSDSMNEVLESTATLIVIGLTDAATFCANHFSFDADMGCFILTIGTGHKIIMVAFI